MLSSHEQVGPYRLDREIGRGGMGVVYLARDTRLDRPVAIKMLPDLVADDADRLARFQRAAKTLASINHPNIAGIYGIEEQAGRRYLILEFVEGATLADRLETGPLPLEDALDIAAQIGAGLEAAHDAGIVHRDLKPANIKITPSGKVKVLDFGLAKSGEDTSASSSSHQAVQTQSPTITRRPSPAIHSPTIPGAIMGTAPYMSPEQARGKSVDKRSDIWSFGVVLYEMLTGISPFHGETVSDSIGAILHREIDLGHLPPGTPPSVRRAIARCLQRDKAHRYRDIGDAVLDLRTIGEPDAPPTTPRSRERARGIFVAVVTLIAFAAAGGWLVANRGQARAAPRVVRFQIDPPDGYTLPSTDGGIISMSLSPDGSALVFCAFGEGTRRLFVRETDASAARPLPGTEGADGPFFSPDGRWIGFSTNDGLRKMPIAGGPPVTIAGARPGMAAWIDQDTIALSDTRTISLLDADGGTPVVLASATLDTTSAQGPVTALGFNHLHRVPGAPYLLASVWNGDTTEAYAIVAVSLTDGAMRPVLNNASGAQFIAPGFLAFLRESSVMVAPFDPVRGEVTGEAMTVIDGVRTSRWADSGFWSASPSGALAYVPGGRVGPGRRLVRVDAAGKATPMIDGVDAWVGGLRVSPDGRSIALLTLRKKLELWSFDIDRRSLTLINTDGESWQPTWTPDSKALIFTRKLINSPYDVVRKSIDAGASAPPEHIGLQIPEGSDAYPYAVTPDGTTLIAEFNTIGPESQRRVIMHPLAQGDTASQGAPSQPTTVPGLRSTDFLVRLSPDGTLAAFQSRESGRGEVYVTPFPGPGPRVQLSTAGGYAPNWSRDGKRVFYCDRADAVHAVDIDTANGVRASAPTRLFDIKGIATASVWGVFDALPDGSFVMVEPAPWENERARIEVVLNWQEELKAKVSGSER